MKNSLSNFIKNSVSEMFSGIIMGELENEKLLIELKENVNISNEKFVEKFFSDEDIRKEVVELFPTETLSISSIDKGQKYIAKGNGVIENPAIYDLTSYVMQFNEDYIQREREFFITKIGNRNINKAIAENMAIARKFQLREFIKKGLPKMVVSSGKFNAKILLSETDYDHNKVHGLIYKLYKLNEIENELIAGGISNDLEINNEKIVHSDLIVLEGYIVINIKNSYEFCLEANSEVNFSIDNKEYFINQGKKVLLAEGIHKIKIVIGNEDNNYMLNFYMKGTDEQKIKIDDELLLIDINSENSIANFTKDSDKGIAVKVIDINRNASSDLGDFVGEVEITYKINTDNKE